MFIRNEEIVYLFDLYNDRLSEAYNERLLSECPVKSAYKDQEIDLIDFVEESILEWTHLYESKLFGGLSFYEYFELLDDEIIAFNYLLHAAYLCDDGVPAVLISLLYKKKDKIVYQILNYVAKVDWQNGLGEDEVAGDDILTVSSLIYLLEKWSCENVYEDLVSKYVITTSPFDIISDAIKSYLSSLKLNDCLVQFLTRNINLILEHNYNMNIRGEVLLISLVAIAAGSNNTSTYLCLRDCFLKTSNKIVSAICFGDLRDERAVKFLRSWLFEYQNVKIDEILRNEIISSIKRLGGKTSDVENAIS